MEVKLTLHWERRINNAFEFGQVIFAGIPDNFSIDSEILMSQEISHIDNIAKRYLRVGVLEIIAQIVGGFSDNFDLANYSANQQIISTERIVIGIAQKIINHIDGVSDMTKIEIVVVEWLIRHKLIRLFGALHRENIC